MIYITPPTLRSPARPRPARRTPFVRSSLASAITDQLTVFTDSRGGPIFPVRSTTPLVIDGVVEEPEKTGPPHHERVNSIN